MTQYPRVRHRYRRLPVDRLGARLRYEITSTDPATYTQPLTLTKHYLWVPGLAIRPYECTEE